MAGQGDGLLSICFGHFVSFGVGVAFFAFRTFSVNQWYRHDRGLMSRKLFSEAPLEPRMRIKSVPAMLSIVLVSSRATVRIANGAGQFPRVRTTHEHEKHILHIVARFVCGNRDEHEKQRKH